MIRDLLYWGLPQRADSPIDNMRIRICNNCMMLIFFAALPFFIRALSWGVGFRMFTLGAALSLLLVALIMLRRGAALVMPANIAMLGISFGVLGAVYSNGGLDNAAAGWLFVLPLYAGLMGGMTSGLIWAGTSLLAIVGFTFAQLSGVNLPALTPGPDTFTQNRLQQFMQFAAIAGCMLAYLYQVRVADRILLQQIDDLGDEVEERQRAESAAFEASQTKSQFLASMSHELRTPLNSVIGFAQRLRSRHKKKLEEENLPKDREYEALNSIYYNGKHLLSLINGLLDLSKIESGQFSLQLGEVSMADLVRRTIGDLQGLAGGGNISLRNEFELSVVLEADEAKLRQIMTNLIANGLKYTEQGSVTIAGYLTKNTRGEQCLAVSVADTGVGISEDQHELLFEPYYNIAKNVKSNVESTGLGLSITKKLVDLHGGEIKVESAPGQGSVFTLILPLKHQQSHVV